jgi:hypothetical protein
MIKITLKKRTSYEVFFGETSLGVFNCQSEWNGFAELTSENEVMIVNRPSVLNQAFGSIFGTDETVEVVKASPGIINLIGSSPSSLFPLTNDQ